jgi:hypothetical protein
MQCATGVLELKRGHADQGRTAEGGYKDLRPRSHKITLQLMLTCSNFPLNSDIKFQNNKQQQVVVVV